MDNHLQAGRPWCVASYVGQLSIAIPTWVKIVSVSKSLGINTKNLLPHDAPLALYPWFHSESLCLAEGWSATLWTEWFWKYFSLPPSFFVLVYIDYVCREYLAGCSPASAVQARCDSPSSSSAPSSRLLRRILCASLWSSWSPASAICQMLSTVSSTSSTQHLWDPCFFCSQTNSLEFTARLSEGSSCRLWTI